jgi:hypothetical protein
MEEFNEANLHVEFYQTTPHHLSRTASNVVVNFEMYRVTCRVLALFL